MEPTKLPPSGMLPKGKGNPLFGGSGTKKNVNFNTSKVAQESNEEDVNAVARRYIFGAEEFEIWKKSTTLKKFQHFLQQINDSIKGKKCSHDVIISDFSNNLLKVLDTLIEWTDKYPPQPIQGRYGNPAFREWFGHVLQNTQATVEKALPDDKKKYSEELAIYLCNSLGNRTRIDFGSGHESAFLMFLCCCAHIDLLGKDDLPCIGLKIFPKYLALCRKLQREYQLEPAGSRGVHGLDDFHFLAYYFGAAQMLGNPDQLKPRDVLDKKNAERYKDEYMYMNAIDDINHVKSGMFAEHSSILYSIATVPHQLWEKVNFGLWVTTKKNDTFLWVIQLNLNFF